MPYLFVARTEPVRTPKFSSDNTSDKRQFCRLSLPVRSHPNTFHFNLVMTSEYFV